MNFYVEKIKEFVKPRFRAEKELDNEIKKLMMENKWISEPFSISRLTGKTESFEFAGEIGEIDYT